MKAIRNQRLSSSRMRKQQHLLEVTVRAGKARSLRYRAVAVFIFKTAFAITLLVGGILGGKEALRRYLWENPEFALADIRVSTDGCLQRDQILAAGCVAAGVNIFTVNTDRIRERLDKIPQVERAEIQLIRPNRLDITVTERRPVAWVTESSSEVPTTAADAWLVDGRGVVMKTKRMMEEYFHLPHISGVQVGDFVPGQRVNTVEMQAALEIVRLDRENTHWMARNLDLSKGYCIVVTDQNHALITFGLDEIEQQLERLNRYLDRAALEKKEIQTVNLIVRKNTPVTFFTPDSNVDTSEDEARRVSAEKAKLASDVKVLSAKANISILKAVPVVKDAAEGRGAKAGDRKRLPEKAGSVSVRKPFR